MTWRPIKDFENYEISDEGQVRSLPHVTIQRGGLHTYKGKLLKPRLDRGGYLIVHLRSKEKNKFLKIHRLVAQAFLPNPDNLPQVNHKNEDKTDNRVENLEWCTAEYNNNYGSRNCKASKSLKGRVVSEQTRKKLSDIFSKPIIQISLTGEVVKQWNGAKEVEKQEGFASANINACCRGKQQTAYGYKWRYIN